MKKWTSIALIILTTSFTGCLDIFETFNINEDGSGVYEQKLDFTRAMQSMTAMMSEKGQEKRKSKKMEKKDSVFYYKSMVDTVSILSATEKAVFGKAYANIHMDEEKGEMSVDIFYPFANASEFETIQNILSRNETNGSFLEGIMKSAGKNKMARNPVQAPDEASPAKDGLPISQYLYNLSGTNLSRKVKERGADTTHKKSELDDMPDDMKEMMKDMMKVNLTTSINMPKPIKDFKGNDGKLSADRKKLTFSKQISLDTKLTNADFDFSINY